MHTWYSWGECVKTAVRQLLHHALNTRRLKLSLSVHGHRCEDLRLFVCMQHERWLGIDVVFFVLLLLHEFIRCIHRHCCGHFHDRRCPFLLHSVSWAYAISRVIFACCFFGETFSGTLLYLNTLQSCLSPCTGCFHFCLICSVLPSPLIQCMFMSVFPYFFMVLLVSVGMQFSSRLYLNRKSKSMQCKDSSHNCANILIHHFKHEYDEYIVYLEKLVFLSSIEFFWIFSFDWVMGLQESLRRFILVLYFLGLIDKHFKKIVS